MSNWIKWTLWGLVTVTFVGFQLALADLSPQHAEFLRIFFWELPCALAQAWIPGL